VARWLAAGRWYWGFKLYLLTAPDGMPITWCLATPKLGEREVAQALLDDLARARALAAGTIILAYTSASRSPDPHQDADEPGDGSTCSTSTPARCGRRVSRG
jgi:hypothetical protein